MAERRMPRAAARRERSTAMSHRRRARSSTSQDVTLRDGMPRHPPPVQRRRRSAQIAAALDAAGVDSIEVAHGDGLRAVELQLRLRRAHRRASGSRRSPSVVEHAKIATLLLPGIGTVDDLQAAPTTLGARIVRVATHCTEADIVAAAHRATPASSGMDVVGLPDDEPHDRRPQALAQQAKLMESYGAHCVYVVDSGGALDMDDVRERFRAFTRRARARDADRHARAPQPVARRRQRDRRGRGRLRPRRRLPGRHGRGRGQRAARGVHRRGRPHGLEPRLRPVSR